MEKKRLSKILAKTDRKILKQMAKEIEKQYQVIVIKEPEKVLTMIKMREPVKESLFYLGEVMVSEAIVELDGTRGMAVVMGDDFEKVLHMAVIDAACNKGVFTQSDTLLKLEKKQLKAMEKENAMFMKTKVNFSSMSAEVQQ